VSEIAALKARLAAQAGEEDLMTFLLGDESGSASYVKDLEAKLRHVFLHGAQSFSPHRL
jgi:hypothetical protein